MTTTLYLIRHAATPVNLMKPSKLQGRRTDSPLAPLGIKQAEATRDFLAVRALDVIYTSPLLRAVQTAEIIAQPHELTPLIVPEITECDVGTWEGKSWAEIQAENPQAYQQYHANPAEFGYLDGENFAQVYDRAAPIIDSLVAKHEGKTIAIVTHYVVSRTYLAGLLGLGPGRARSVWLENCGISIIGRESGKMMVKTVNASFHLQGVAA